MAIDVATRDRIHVGSLDDLKARGRMVVRGRHCPLLVVYEQGQVHALDNRCPHLGFPLHKGSIQDGILTCHWHHARFDLKSGGTFDLWADDVPTTRAWIEDGEVWVAPECRLADPAGALAPAPRRRHGAQSRPRDRQVGARCARRRRPGCRAGARCSAVRRPPSRRLRRRHDDHDRARQPVADPARGGGLPGAVPGHPAGRRRLRRAWRRAAIAQRSPAPARASPRSSAGFASGPRGGIATPPSARCSPPSTRACRWTGWRRCCSSRSPTGRLPTAAMRSTSSTRPSSASS